MAAKDHLNKEQYTKVVHVSSSPTPPHNVDHPLKDYYEHDAFYFDDSYPDDEQEGAEEPDRYYTNDVLFAGDKKDTSKISKSLQGRSYVHHYDVPSSLISPETYADDDDPYGNLTDKHIKGPVRELWHDLPARREDAVVNQRVVKFINASENPGDLSYILPKSKIQSGDIKYRGRKGI